MMQELDNTFDAVVMVGYHSYAGSDGNPLSHTLEDDMAYIKINGEFASEFLINAYTASLVGVPVVFVSGDAELCKNIYKINPDIKTVETSKCKGNSVICKHPDVVNSNIKEGVEASLKTQFRNFIPLPGHFEVELSYNLHTKAYKSSFYPGMKQITPKNLEFTSSDYFEVLRMLSFVV